MRGWTFLIAAAVAIGSAQADSLSDYRQAHRSLTEHSKGLGHDGSPQGKRALEKLWSAAGGWAADYLDSHPAATAEQLNAIATKLNIGLIGLKLDSNTWVVSYSYGETGTFFVLAKHGGRFRELWRIDTDRTDLQIVSSLKRLVG